MPNCKDCIHYIPGPNSWGFKCNHTGTCTISKEEGFSPKVNYWEIL